MCAETYGFGEARGSSIRRSTARFCLQPHVLTLVLHLPCTLTPMCTNILGWEKFFCSLACNQTRSCFHECFRSFSVSAINMKPLWGYNSRCCNLSRVWLPLLLIERFIWMYYFWIFSLFKPKLNCVILTQLCDLLINVKLRSKPLSLLLQWAENHSFAKRFRGHSNYQCLEDAVHVT